ncbi:MAG: hypothetical protein ACR2M1_13865 [Gemmatimonadaceae bacterium]
MDATTIDALARLGVGALLGTTIGSVSTFLVARYNHNREDKKGREKAQDDALVQPVVDFVDSAMRFASTTPWERLEGNQTLDVEQLRRFRSDEGTVAPSLRTR